MDEEEEEQQYDEEVEDGELVANLVCDQTSESAQTRPRNHPSMSSEGCNATQEESKQDK